VAFEVADEAADGGPGFSGLAIGALELLVGDVVLVDRSTLRVSSLAGCHA